MHIDQVRNNWYKKIIRKWRFWPRDGTFIKNEYYLHPRAFKFCLIRSLKTKKYAKYYLLFNDRIKYFNYQDKLKEKYFIKLKNKIYSLEEN